jgi:ERCC4-type nuclease
MSGNEPIEVVVDDRESRGGVAAVLAARDDVVLRVERLPLGDYRIEGRLLVERKTLPDLVQSISDGRLFTQGCRLADAGVWTAVILEGTGRDLADSGMRREAIQGALITLTLYLGVPLLRARGPEESARLMLYAARQGRALATRPLARIGRQPRTKLSVQTRVLQGLPGIGPERARRLLERFGDLEAVMAAGVTELASVRGIGRSTAQAIRWAVKDESDSFSWEQAADGLFML